MNNMIALQARGANVRPARNRQAAMQGQNAMLQQQMNELQYTQALEGKARQDEIRNAMKANPNAGYGELSQIYRQHGDLAGALEMDKAAMDWRTGKSQLAKADAELFKNQLEIFGQVAPNIKDDASFQQAIGQMYEAGVIGEPRARQLLDMGYSPELVEQLQRGALSAKDRMAQDFDREKFDYAKGQDAKNLQLAERRTSAAEVAATKPGVLITNAGPKEHDKIDAKYYSELYQGLQSAERDDQKRVMDYKLIDKLIGDAYSGTGGQQVQSAKKLAQVVGVDVGDVSGPEAAAMVSNALALQLRNPSGGAGMPGAMSDHDREFLQKMVPGLTTTSDGRALMVEVQKRIAKRSRQVAKDAREYRLKNRYLDVSFEQMMANKYGQQDIFSDLYESVPAAGAEGETDLSGMSDDDVLRALTGE